MNRGIPRVLEAAIALACLTALAPVLCLTALVVMISSGRPVLFRQVRAGRRGTPFTLYKFRSMRLSRGGLQVTAEDDPRITRVGRLLRVSKLDELPELWNVLRGDMSLVGPRPEALRYVDTTDPRWQPVLQVRPGLTDPVTLALRNEQALLAEVGGDRERFYLSALLPWKLHGYAAYLGRRNWRSDLVVLWQTVFAIVFPGSIRRPTLEEIRSFGGGQR